MVLKLEIAAKIDSDAVTSECLAENKCWKELVQNAKPVPETMKIPLSKDLLTVARPFG